jgi:hypothetical protein
VPIKNANAKTWVLRSSDDGNKWSAYPQGNKPAALPNYSTTFPSDENPISEGGNWTSINTTLTQARTIGGNCTTVFSGDMTAYQDGYALKSGSWPDDQEVVATVYKASGYSPADNHEIEILLRGSETTTTRTWYECLWDIQGNMSFVYLTGPANGFTDMGNDFYAGALVPQDGMVARAKVVGQGNSTVLSFYVDEVLRLQKTVTNAGQQIASGRPGMGFFTRLSTVNSSLGWATFLCRTAS